MKLLMTMMIHQLSVTSNKVSSQLISPQNWPVFISPLTQSEPDIYHLNSNQSLKKFPVVLTCTYFSFYLSCGPRGIFYYLESITWSFHNHMCLLHYSRLNSSHSKDICEIIFFVTMQVSTPQFNTQKCWILYEAIYIVKPSVWTYKYIALELDRLRLTFLSKSGRLTLMYSDPRAQD